MFKRTISPHHFLVPLLSAGAWIAATPVHAQTVVYANDFNAALGAEWSGVTTTGSVQGYAGIGPVGNQFGGNFLINDSLPAAPSTLTLTGLPAHTSINLGFLLGIIDSWDGSSPNFGPDLFNVSVDGTPVFSNSFNNLNDVDQGYVPAPGVLLTPRNGSGAFNGLGFGGTYGESAYNMSLDSLLQNIPHTASTLTIRFFASGIGWQGGADESWGIDNLSVSINSPVAANAPEPGSLALLVPGVCGMILGIRKRRK